MRKQFVLTHRHTILEETENTWQILNRPIRKRVMFLRKYKDKKSLCGHNILTEGVFVTQLSSNARIRVTDSVSYDKLQFYER
jgi:hypothetical protein